tara:strand:+ start:10825 stop:11061 length:237 start_codon:yes stop_codon:yes gene_type:complete
MKIVIKENYIKCQDTSFLAHFFTIHYKTGLFFWKTIEEDLIFGMAAINFKSVKESKQHIDKNLINNHKGDYSIEVKYH